MAVDIKNHKNNISVLSTIENGYEKYIVTIDGKIQKYNSYEFLPREVKEMIEFKKKQFNSITEVTNEYKKSINEAMTFLKKVDNDKEYLENQKDKVNKIIDFIPEHSEKSIHKEIDYNIPENNFSLEINTSHYSIWLIYILGFLIFGFLYSPLFKALLETIPESLYKQVFSVINASFIAFILWIIVKSVRKWIIKKNNEEKIEKKVAKNMLKILETQERVILSQLIRILSFVITLILLGFFVSKLIFIIELNPLYKLVLFFILAIMIYLLCSRVLSQIFIKK